MLRLWLLTVRVLYPFYLENNTMLEKCVSGDIKLNVKLKWKTRLFMCRERLCYHTILTCEKEPIEKNGEVIGLTNVFIRWQPFSHRNTHQRVWDWMAMSWLESTTFTKSWYFLGCCFDSITSPRGNCEMFGLLIIC